MEGNARAEDGGKHHLLVYYRCLGLGQRGGDLYVLVVQGARQLVGHYLAHALQIAAESQGVALDVRAAHFRKVLAEQRRALGKVHYFYFVLM